MSLSLYARLFKSTTVEDSGMAWKSAAYSTLMDTLYEARAADEGRNTLVEDYLKPYADWRYHTFEHIA